MGRGVWLFMILMAAITLPVFTSPALGAPSSKKTWTDTQGRTMQARFIRIHQGYCIFDRGGKVLRVSFFKLSEEDREYLQELLESKGQASSIPTVDPEQAQQAQAKDGMQPGASGESPSPAAGPGLPSPAGPSVPNRFRGMMPGFSPPMPSMPSMPETAMPPSLPGSSIPGSSSRPRMPGLPESPPSVSPPPPPPPPSPSSPFSAPPGFSAPTFPSASPSMAPPSPSFPNMPSSGPPTGGHFPGQFYEAKQCMKCKKEVPPSAAPGQRCPHCNTYWEYEDLGNGQVRDTAGRVKPRSQVVRYGFPGGLLAIIIMGLLRWWSRR